MFDLSCKEMSRDLPGFSFKAPELTEIKGIQESKGINKGDSQEKQIPTCRVQTNKVYTVGLKDEPHKYRYSRASGIDPLK